MPSTPNIPTPLVQIRVAAQRGADAPDVVLVRPADTEGPPVLGPGAGELGVDEQWLTRHLASTAAAAVLPVPLATGSHDRPDHGWLLGIGQGSPRDWRAAGAALVRAASSRAAEQVAADQQPADRLQVNLPVGTGADEAAALALGCVVSSHRYQLTSADPPPRIATVRLVTPAGATVDEFIDAVGRAEVLGRATGLARDLANTPSGLKDPAWLAATAARLATEVPGLQPTVYDEQWLAEHGFGGVLAVGAGSVRPPRLLQLAWDPPEVRTDQHLVLVGKGITFDTGGISVKPADGMHLMRTDMSGGAAVIAALLAVAELALPLRVTGLVPCAENHLSGSAYRPGDVVRHVDGTTTEVTNTDAEGRLVLADALAHAVQTLNPTMLVDVATLTGAMKVSLGLRTGGLFATEPGLAERIRAAGKATGEDWWPMPLVEDYAADVRSQLADLRQCPPGPGGITAALFLREFTGGRAWAHLDIAGPARSEKSYDEVNPGGTGFAARTLVELAYSLTR
ncbi:MAG TPA: M17 family metallopeptidase [Pseudonocardiaceae bacterium]|nr:M17 family metallopeptidase [Pseudonocardiaceae bacterium]